MEVHVEVGFKVKSLLGCSWVRKSRFLIAPWQALTLSALESYTLNPEKSLKRLLIKLLHDPSIP